MAERDQAEQIEQLLIETTALRLTIRSILAHLLLTNDRPIIDTIAAFRKAAEKMSPEVLPIPGLDPDLHHKAAALARKRADDLLRNIGSLVAPSKNRAATLKHFSEYLRDVRSGGL